MAKGGDTVCRWWHNGQSLSYTRCHRFNRSTTCGCGSTCTSNWTPFCSRKRHVKVGCGGLPANLFTVIFHCSVHCPLRRTLSSRTGSRISATTWGFQNLSPYRKYGCVSMGSLQTRLLPQVPQVAGKVTCCPTGRMTTSRRCLHGARARISRPSQSAKLTQKFEAPRRYGSALQSACHRHVICTVCIVLLTLRRCPCVVTFVSGGDLMLQASFFSSVWCVCQQVSPVPVKRMPGPFAGTGERSSYKCYEKSY